MSVIVLLLVWNDFMYVMGLNILLVYSGLFVVGLVIIMGVMKKLVLLVFVMWLLNVMCVFVLMLCLSIVLICVWCVVEISGFIVIWLVFGGVMMSVCMVVLNVVMKL